MCGRSLYLLPLVASTVENMCSLFNFLPALSKVVFPLDKGVKFAQRLEKNRNLQFHFN